MVANGSVAVYTCELGYTISGVTSRTCKSDGTGWSESDPTCCKFWGRTMNLFNRLGFVFSRFYEEVQTWKALCTWLVTIKILSYDYWRVYAQDQP